MDAEDRQSGKSTESGCCWTVIALSLIGLAGLAAFLNIFAIGLWRPEADLITQDEEPLYWTGIAVEGVVFASILAAAILRMRSRLKQYPPADQRKFITRMWSAIIFFSALGFYPVVVSVGIVLSIGRDLGTDFVTYSITIAIDVTVLGMLLAWAIVRQRRERK
jgi:hypothetical protein